MHPDTSLLSEWLPICNVSEVAPESARSFVVAHERLVVWRDAAGHIQVWRDYCPHRGAQLSLGTVRAGELVCPYHGWRYDTSGRCVHIPSNPSLVPPGRACASSFHAQEKYDVVWVCLGEPAHPLDLFPEYDIADARCINLAPQTIHSSGPRVVENFLDMAHFPFVHEGILGEHPQTEVPDYEVVESDGGLEASGCYFWQPAGLPGRTGAQIEYTYRVKRPLVASLSKQASGGQGALHIMIVVSPVSETETRAWLVSVHEDDTVHTDQQLYDFNLEILLQDTPIVESQHPKYLPLDLATELHQRCDRMSVAYRRWLSAQAFSYGTSLGVSAA
jgi:phenylpropionate dioxygenase-like ring-hydroxylating dioxygenase large terminal subunit